MQFDLPIFFVYLLLLAPISAVSQTCQENEITVSIQNSTEWNTELIYFIKDANDSIVATGEHYSSPPNSEDIMTDVWCISDGCFLIEWSPFLWTNGSIGIEGNGVPLLEFQEMGFGEVLHFSPNGLNCPCPADISGDGIADISDFLQLNSAYGSSCPSCAEDIDGNGQVDVNDFLMLNTLMNLPCNP